jgi:hypothetical protein
VIDHISEASVRKPHGAIFDLTGELMPSVNSLEIDMPFDQDNESLFRFSQIITDMPGQGFLAGPNCLGRRKFELWMTLGFLAQ